MFATSSVFFTYSFSLQLTIEFARSFLLSFYLISFSQNSLSSQDVTNRQPLEESWRLISKLRKNLPPNKLRAIVTRCGLPNFGNLSETDSSLEPTKIDAASLSLPSQSAASSGDAWMTLADVKVHVIKAVCYEVASKGFQQTRQEIEAACMSHLRDMCQLYGKRDPDPTQTWRTVARDVMETIGFCDDSNQTSDREIGEFIPKRECSRNAERRKAVKATLDDVILKVVANEASDFGSLQKPISSRNEIEELKESFSYLVHMFKGVKLDNESKDEEMKLMRSKMEEMERALCGNADYGKSLLMRDFVNRSFLKDSEITTDSFRKFPISDSNSIATTSDGEKDNSSFGVQNSESGFSSRYIHSNDFSEPSHGVIVPDSIKTKQEKIKWLMENDVAFRRGRLRWEAQQKRHQANLRSQEINREKRRLQRESKQSNLSRKSPRFSFKNSKLDNRDRQRSSPRKYFEGPRRKTFSSVIEREAIFDNKGGLPLEINDVKYDPEEVGPEKKCVDSFLKVQEIVKSQDTDFIQTSTETFCAEKTKLNKRPYVSQRRMTWCNTTPACQESPLNVPQQLHQPLQQIFVPGLYRSQPSCPEAFFNQEWPGSATLSRTWDRCHSGLTFFDLPYPAMPQSNITFLNQPVSNFHEERFSTRSFIEAPITYTPIGASHYYVNNQLHSQRDPPIMFVEKPQFFLRPSVSESVTSPVNPPQLYHNPLNDISPTPRPQHTQRSSQSPPYMSTSREQPDSTDNLSPAISPADPDQPISDLSETSQINTKRKSVLKGIYQPPFRRRNFPPQAE